MALQTTEQQLRAQLGDAHVDDFLTAAGQVGRSYLSGDEDLVFGFIQRVLAHLRNQDRSYGLIFPKVDQAYRKMFDYFDGAGNIYVIYPGAGDPAMLDIAPDWVHATGDFYEVPEPKAAEIVLAFLGVYAHLRFTHALAPGPHREASRLPDTRG